MKYCLVSVPPSLGTPDDFFLQSSKAPFCTTFWKTPHQKICHSSMRLCSSKTAWRCSMPLPTCGEICLKVLDQMVAKKHFLFSTDSYHPQPIKAQERLGRGRLFWVDQRQGNDMTSRRSLQMTTTRCNSVSSCCEYGVVNRLL